MNTIAYRLLDSAKRHLVIGCIAGTLLMAFAYNTQAGGCTWHCDNKCGCVWDYSANACHNHAGQSSSFSGTCDYAGGCLRTCPEYCARFTSPTTCPARKSW